MDVVVAGASGLIGRALRPALEAAGHRVIPLGRGAGSGASWDPAAGTIDDGVLEGVGAVVNLCGERIRAGRWTKAHKRAVLESRVGTTALLAEAIAGVSRPPAVLLNASAVGIYGERGDEELTEDSGRGDGFLSDVCAAWEAATAPATAAGVRVANLRTGLVLAGDGGLMKAFMPPGPFVAGRLGSGMQWMSWITIVDEVRAIVHLLEGEVSGPVNLTAPAPVRNREFVGAVSAVTGKRALPPVPALAIKAMFGSQAAADTALVSQRALPRRLLASGFEFVHDQLDAGLRAVLSPP